MMIQSTLQVQYPSSPQSGSTNLNLKIKSPIFLGSFFQKSNLHNFKFKVSWRTFLNFEQILTNLSILGNFGQIQLIWQWLTRKKRKHHNFCKKCQNLACNDLLESSLKSLSIKKVSKNPITNWNCSCVPKIPKFHIWNSQFFWVKNYHQLKAKVWQVFAVSGHVVKISIVIKAFPIVFQHNPKMGCPWKYTKYGSRHEGRSLYSSFFQGSKASFKRYFRGSAINLEGFILVRH